jgi:stearoyl-CoA desaturase (delta-9 desaturase)
MNIPNYLKVPFKNFSSHSFFMLLGIVAPIYTVIWATMHWDFWSIMSVCVAAWLGGGVSSLFVHRAWSHHAWKPNRTINLLGLFAYAIGFTGPHIAWVGIHRVHHRMEDTPEDPHSPYHMSRWRVLFWPYCPIQQSYVSDLLRDPDHVFFIKYYWHINIAFWIAVVAIDPALLAWWFAVSGLHSLKMRSINVIGHNNPATKSTNNSFVWGYLYLNGEPWHDNHSKNPRDWEIGKEWWQIDLSKQCIKLFVKCGWAKLNYHN